MATKRGYYLEEIDRAISNLEMALTHIARVVEAYKEAHPDISDAAKSCGDGIVVIGETLQQIHEMI